MTAKYVDAPSRPALRTVCPHLLLLLRYCLQNLVQYFKFTKLGPLSTQLPFNDTLLVIPFFKKKGKYEYCFDSKPSNYWLSTIVDF